MRLFHTHRWAVVHPIGYQDHVRVIRCETCGKELDRGVRGESDQIIHWGFDATTGRTLFG